ncbi:MAG: PQQ-binding-like beta-propeller repeat protein [Lentisphaerae bacterium]|nr:PQQ-binding-like beta-propeller repeat protein [Lentisphaerota bacterium]MBT4822958.1 PQQ-binding-like beta-propeller repeat protein [Lentisphaerota bacterium]MBT5605314.1 PQQ-binding-like beta-propeller repeat protein [Lentisphaerota bacterium]MBT7057536.1 PQQ-binding-like beta-propeller repeat protein [Lentisphaerota bacterium]MBT7840698.1 PQQ-binding-like beta-propeller repeat protein [Lentisphaerota bacterium]
MASRLKGLLTSLATVGVVSVSWADTPVPLLVDAIAGQIESVGGMASVVCHGNRPDLLVPLARALPSGFFIHGVASPLRCPTVREQVRDAGLTGRVAVSAVAASERLPYRSDLLNIVVLDDLIDATVIGDMLQVLAPEGQGFARIGARPEDLSLIDLSRVVLGIDIRPLPGTEDWVTFRKPWPEDIGEWGHHFHGPDNNPVTPDLRVGPPRRLQWTTGPRWSRNHESAGSLPAMVSAAGRLFAVIDEGPIGISAENVPDKWRLIARDAFNGRLLWKRPTGDWGWRSWRKNWITRSVPSSMARGLVAVGNRVVLTDGFRGQILILNSVNGELLRRCPETEGTDEIVVSSDLILAVQQTEGGGQLVRALASSDGRTLWTKEAQCRPQTLCALNSRVFWWDGDVVVAHARASGERLWSTEPLKKSRWGHQYNLMVTGETVLAASHGYHGLLTALDSASGKQLWQTRARGGYVFSAPDIFVIDGTVWADGYFEEWLPANQRKQIAQGKVTRESIPAICRWPTLMKATGRELRTGDVLREIDTGGMFKTGHHHRCYRCRATSRFIMAGRRGTEFVDLKGDQFSVDNWVRGSCQFGFMPANGLLYATPHPCSCYLAAKLTGFNALGPALIAPGKDAASEDARGRLRPVTVLGRGTRPHAGETGSSRGTGDDWPAYRADAARSGGTTSPVPAVLHSAWQATLGGRLTQPVVSGETALVACVDKGTLYAFDCASGGSRWCFSAGGRIDSAPSIVGDRVLFGCQDGHLYCLNLGDGKLVWEQRVAPNERFVGDHGQIASTWPVHGAVLVSQGTVYAAAGRASVLDGGIHVRGFDVETGVRRYQAAVDHTFSDPRKAAENNSGLMQGFRPDILLREGDSIFMRHAKFGLDLAVRPRDGNALLAARVKHWGKVWAVQGTLGDGPHLVAGSGLLDNTMFNRMSWVRGDAAGQLIVWDEDITCTVNMFRMPKRKLLSPVFFPGTDGVLVTGRKTWTKGNSPHNIPLEPPAADCLWQRRVPLRIEAMVLAGGTLFVAGQPDRVDVDDPLGALEGRKGGRLIAIDSRSGDLLHELALAAPPVFDGLSAAGGRLWMSTRSGTLVSLGAPE